jgi:hypothetical protein
LGENPRVQTKAKITSPNFLKFINDPLRQTLYNKQIFTCGHAIAQVRAK